MAKVLVGRPKFGIPVIRPVTRGQRSAGGHLRNSSCDVENEVGLVDADSLACENDTLPSKDGRAPPDPNEMRGDSATPEGLLGTTVGGVASAVPMIPLASMHSSWGMNERVLASISALGTQGSTLAVQGGSSRFSGSAGGAAGGGGGVSGLSSGKAALGAPRSGGSAVPPPLPSRGSIGDSRLVDFESSSDGNVSSPTSSADETRVPSSSSSSSSHAASSSGGPSDPSGGHMKLICSPRSAFNPAPSSRKSTPATTPLSTPRSGCEESDRSSEDGSSSSSSSSVTSGGVYSSSQRAESSAVRTSSIPTSSTQNQGLAEKATSMR